MSAPRASAPTVSVIVPVYNRPTLLPVALQSVFDQTTSDWELLVVDDGSTDSTAQVLARFAADPRVRGLTLAHSGNPAVARNAALAMARGEFLAFLDSDDRWMPDKLERQIAQLRARPSRPWNYTGFVHVDAQGRELDDGVAKNWMPCEGSIFEAAVRGRAPIRTASVVMANRELVQQAGGFDERLVSGQDYDLWMRLALHTEVSVVDRPLTAVRVHARSHSSEWPPRALEYRDLSLEKMARIAGPQWQSLIAGQRRRNAAALAASYLTMGDRHGMLVSIRRSLSMCWFDPRWWASSLRTCARAVHASSAVRGAESRER